MVERQEGAFQAFAPNETFQLAELAPRLPQELAIRTRAVREDCPLHQIEEIVFASFEPPTKDLPALGDGERIAEVGRKPAEQPKPHDEVVRERPYVPGFPMNKSHGGGIILAPSVVQGQSVSLTISGGFHIIPDGLRGNLRERAILSFATVVVTYQPDTEAITNLQLIAESCPKLFVIDNTPRRDTTSFPTLEGATVVKLGENIGLAAALNRGIRLAGLEGYEDIFLLDQDSRLPESFFMKMLCFKSVSDKKTATGALYVPNFYDRNTKTFARFPLLTRASLRRRTCSELRDRPLRGALIAITSGTLIAYSKYLQIGQLREDYFIESVDNEYCLRVWKRGFRVALNCRVTIDHAIGKRVVRRFLGLKLRPNFHAPLRRYYMARNGIRTSLDYFAAFPLYLPFIIAGLFLEVLSILLYERSKTRKICALLVGLLHGLIGPMGKCPFSF
jgi:rhamnosyltransferase